MKVRRKLYPKQNESSGQNIRIQIIKRFERIKEQMKISGELLKIDQNADISTKDYD